MTTNEFFAWYDYLFMGAFLAVSICLGITFAFIGGRQRTLNEFFTANSGLGFVPVALSLYMTANSGTNILGNAAEMYTHGVQMWFSVLGQLAAVIVSVLWFAPMFYRLKLVSYNEWVYGRFKSRAAQYLNTVFNILRAVLFIGFNVYAPCVALEAVTVIPMWACIVGLCVIATIYTTLGGMKAVVWTDSFQAATMFGGSIAICVLAVQVAGGIEEVWDVCVEYQRMVIEFTVNPIIRMSFWSTTVGNFVTFLTMWGPSQFAVQRFSSVSSLWKAQMSLFLQLPLGWLLSVVTFMMGAAMFTYWEHAGCDPLANGQAGTDELLPIFILTGIAKPVLPGVFAAVLLAGSLSSISTTISSCAAMIWRDFMADRGRYKHVTERTKTIINKVITIIFGAISIGIGYGMQFFTGHILQVALALNTAAMSPVLGMFLLGALIPQSNAIGAIVGGICGFCVHMTLGLGSSIIGPYPLTKITNTSECLMPNMTDPSLYEEKEGVNVFFKIAFEYFMLTATLATFIVGLIVSFLTGPTNPKDVDPRYMLPIFNWTCCYLPSSWLKKCWCGIDFTDVVNFKGERYNFEESSQSDSEEKDDVSIMAKDGKYPIDGLANIAYTEEKLPAAFSTKSDDIGLSVDTKGSEILETAYL